MSIKPYEGYTHILRIIDVNTAWALSTGIQGRSAQTVGYEMAVFFAVVGCPAILQSDNGSEFLGDCLKVLKTWAPEMHIIKGR